MALTYKRLSREVRQPHYLNDQSTRADDHCGTYAQSRAYASRWLGHPVHDDIEVRATSDWTLATELRIYTRSIDMECNDLARVLPRTSDPLYLRLYYLWRGGSQSTKSWDCINGSLQQWLSPRHV